MFADQRYLLQGATSNPRENFQFFFVKHFKMTGAVRSMMVMDLVVSYIEFKVVVEVNQ